MAGKIKIDFEKCKGCGLCIAVCPKNSIVFSKNPTKAAISLPKTKNLDCTGCCACALICPDAAIIVFRDEKEEKGKGTKEQKQKR